MSKKKRRKRPAPLRPPEKPDGSTSQTAKSTNRQSRPVSERRAARSRPVERPLWGRRSRTPEGRRTAAAEWVHPPVAATVARGMAIVGESPVLVVSAFVSSLLLWLLFTAYGAHMARFPGLMAMMLALPPVHSLFLDISALLGGSPKSGPVGLAFLGALLIIRAALMAFWVSYILTRLPGPREVDSPAGSSNEGSLVRALRRSLRILAPMVVMEAGFFALSITTAAMVAFALGQFAVIAALVGGFYFFVYTPVIIGVEGLGVREAARLSYRAARFPGPRHMLATFSYLVVALFVSVFIPPSRVAASTPDLNTWLFVLLMSFIHLAALATFVYRWLLIREKVLAAAGEPRTRRPLRTIRARA